MPSWLNLTMGVMGLGLQFLQTLRWPHSQGKGCKGRLMTRCFCSITGRAYSALGEPHKIPNILRKKRQLEQKDVACYQRAHRWVRCDFINIWVPQFMKNSSFMVPILFSQGKKFAKLDCHGLDGPREKLQRSGSCQKCTGPSHCGSVHGTFPH